MSGINWQHPLVRPVARWRRGRQLLRVIARYRRARLLRRLNNGPGSVAILDVYKPVAGPGPWTFKDWQEPTREETPE